MTVYRKIPLVFSDDVLGYLATMAAQRHTDIPTLIEAAVERDVRADAKRRRKRDPYEPRPALQQLDLELSRARREGLRAPHHDRETARRLSKGSAA